MRTAGLLLTALVFLAACGGNRVDRYAGGAAVQFSSGPISKACLGSGRKAANGRLCGCIQGVANRSLSGGDQRMAAKFFSDPHRAQEIRQSDNRSHEAFWQRYKAFAAQSEQICSGL
ncbi:arginine transporter [Thalassococcus sp. CAU 1522]|uniref:Arginine transporter n=1 Tax=Thalassococcus arenae TaxID=2851652 RepID=A0ABS6N3A0_9RHOB|nr:arginine transporter [Thalassococcus arenae]MBV2358493.1 arginine transporter [Thalassococcus arenae]